MKKIFKYIIPLSITLFAASCGSDAVLDEMNDDELVEVKFTPTSAVQSRFDDDGFDNGDRVFIYRVQDNGNFGEKKEFKYSNGNLLPVTDTFKKKKTETVEFVAFTPGYSESSGRIIYYGGSTDYLFTYAKTSSASVELPFIHVHSQIRIRVLNNKYSIRSVQLLNIYNQEHIYYDDNASEIIYTCGGPVTTASMSKDSYSTDFPYYYYLPNGMYLPDVQLKVTDSSGASKTFNFPSTLSYSESSHIYYLDADMSGRSNTTASRSGDDMLELECVKIEPIN